jgi:hypothetical protein
MVPRDEVYRTNWELPPSGNKHFSARVNGEPQPWSKDAILNEYKFCAHIELATGVSQYLIRNVIYDGVSRNEEDTVFRILLFKIFNQMEHGILVTSPLVTFLSQLSVLSSIQRYSMSSAPRDKRSTTMRTCPCATKAFGIRPKTPKPSSID